MHTPSATGPCPRSAYERSEEYGPAIPAAPDLPEAMSLVERTRPAIGEEVSVRARAKAIAVLATSPPDLIVVDLNG